MVRAVTLKDIARETGVHVSTVSRALDPRARDSLTDEVVARVTETAQRLGYRPNRLAAGLRTKRTKTVGLSTPDITNPLFPPIVRGVESVLEPAGYVSIIVNTDGRRDRERFQMQVLMERGVDGVVHAAVERDYPYFDDIRQQSLPIVTVNRALDFDGVPGIVNDEAAGITAMFRLLHDAGHRRIAHVTGPEGNVLTAARREGVLEERARLDLPARDDWIIRGDFSLESGAEAARRIIAMKDRPTAVFCAADMVAFGLIAGLVAGGLSVPGDISVVGFDDIDMSDYFVPALTTIRQDRHRLGRDAAQALRRRLGPRPPRTEDGGMLPVELVTRGSTAPLKP